MIYYLIVFAASFIVDLIPAFGPPAWTVMVLMQVKFDLNIWGVLFAGVSGSTVGRWMLSAWIVPGLSEKVLHKNKNKDLQFLGERLNQKGWRSLLFVFVYTLVPIPTGPLFTVAGIARVRAKLIIPAFFVGKFISDAMMVYSGKFAHEFVDENGWYPLWSWQSVLALILGLFLVSIVLFVDWMRLLQFKQLRFNFRIWKTTSSSK